MRSHDSVPRQSLILGRPVATSYDPGDRILVPSMILQCRRALNTRSRDDPGLYAWNVPILLALEGFFEVFPSSSRRRRSSTGASRLEAFTRSPCPMAAQCCAGVMRSCHMERFFDRLHADDQRERGCSRSALHLHLEFRHRLGALIGGDVIALVPVLVVFFIMPASSRRWLMAGAIQG